MRILARLVALLLLSVALRGQVIVRTVCGPGGPISPSVGVSSGETPNHQTGTSYTILNTDCGKLVTLSNVASIAVTLPQANSITFRSGWFVDVQNIGSGTATITPSTSTIDGVSSLVLRTNQGARIISDGTNYSTQRGGAGVVPSGITSISTSNGITGGPITGTGTISGIDALADGATKGVSAFTAADFDSSGGVISLDYTNGQKASGSQPGFLSSADWTTFNNKQAALGFTAVPSTRTINTTSPITGGGDLSADRTIACATCVVASSPGSGIAHFAGSTQTVTSSAVSLTADVSGITPVANGGAVAQGSNLCGTSDLCASGSFTSAQIVSITSTASTRLSIIAAPASGSIILIDNALFEVAYNGTPYAAGSNMQMYYDNASFNTASVTAVGPGAMAQTNKNFTLSLGANLGNANTTNSNGKGVYLGVASTSFTCASTCGSVYYWVKYRIVTGLQ